MEQKFESLKKENPEQLAEHLNFVRDSVKDGSYFKDGLNWYFFRYVNPFCERTVLSFASIAACIICYCLVIMIKGAFPLVQKDPIIIRSYDESRFFPNLIPLKPHSSGPGSEKYDPAITTVDEAIAKYLVSVYVTNREGYDFSAAEVDEVNTKFNHIRNTSVDSEYREFQSYMSKDNPDSPILNFGRNISKTIEIKSVKFVKKEEKDFTSKAKNFISAKIPTNAEVRFTSVLKSIDDEGQVKIEQQNYLAKIDFSFSGALKIDKKDRIRERGNKPLDFMVKNYKLYKVD